MIDYRYVRGVASFLGATCLGGVVALAQERPSSLIGRVTEMTGLPVAQVVVTRLNVATRMSDVTKTDSEGRFEFNTVAPGTYQLTFQKTGFEPVVREAVTVAGVAGSAGHVVNVVLEPERLKEFVTVVAPRPAPSTATKLDLPARDVPVTVGTIDSQTLQEQGVDTLATAVRNISGATGFVRYGAYMSFTVRGFNTEGGTANLLVLTDGVRDEGGRIATQLTNVERIEVLKGPASVLYGGEGLAGAVNLIRKKPSLAPAYDFSAAAGSFNTYRTAFGATGALGSNKVLYRVDTGLEHADNWRDAGSRRVDVTPSLYWSPTATDRLTAHVSVARDSFDTDSGIPLINGRDFPNIPLSRRFNTPQDYAISQNRSLQLHYERTMFDSVQLRNVVSYRWYDIDYFSAETVTVKPPSSVNRQFLYFDSHVRPLLNQTEIQAQFRVFGLESRLLGGWEFERFNSVSDRSASASTLTTPIDLFKPVETHVSRQIPVTGFVNFQNTINAFFVQEHLSLRDNVKLLVGGRADLFRRWNRNDTVVNAVTVPGLVTRSAVDAFSPRAGLVYQANPWMSFYGSYASSFTPVNTIPNDGRSLEPERGRQFEVGQRLDLLKQRLNVTTTIYNLTRRQVPITIASTPTGPIIEQAGEQRARGAEVDVIGRLSDRWQVTGNYGFTDSIYVDFKSGGIDVAGRQTAFAPRHTANVWSTHALEHGVGLGIGGRFVGNRFTNFFNDVPLASYATLDAAVFYRQKGWDLALNLNNVLNKERYFIGALYNTQLYPGAPFNALLTMRVHVK